MLMHFLLQQEVEKGNSFFFNITTNTNLKCDITTNWVVLGRGNSHSRENLIGQKSVRVQHYYYSFVKCLNSEKKVSKSKWIKWDRLNELNEKNSMNAPDPRMHIMRKLWYTNTTENVCIHTNFSICTNCYTLLEKRVLYM